jgi:hypothetical protein
LAELHAAPDKKTTFAPYRSGKRFQLQQLHGESAPKKGGASLKSIEFMEYIMGCSTKSKFV